ncbi:MAG TPA: tetratricopeptide repeat protein [Thermoanaerobaculia bacterium]|jgi:thioredoxin-like negative regulator of GroEL|nr:tetratricopeptide repeat protein [Thermoanaerobaculia bacterium]
MRRGHVAPFLLAAGLAMAATAPVLGEPPAKSATDKDEPTTGKDKSADALIQEGQSLHDAGRYDEAIARYRQALALEPGNATALYELAFSYHAKKDYAHCLEATREGLKHPEDQGARLYSQQGTCLDDAGRGAEAVTAYREGLTKYAHDGHLRYNYAVALWRQKKGAEAIPELITTIGDEPDYDSPYMLLAVLEHEQQLDVQALFALLRYVTIDSTSERSQQAATMALGLFKAGITTKPAAGKDAKSETQVVLSPDSLGGGGGIYSTLALSRSLAAASIESGEGQTDADRVAEALASWLGIASELSASADAATTGGAEWRLVAEPLLALDEHELAKPFGYLVAERAQIPGGSEWVKANGAAMRQLEAALADAPAH